MEKITKETLEKEEVSFLFEYNGYIKTYTQMRDHSCIDIHIPILILNNEYTFNTKGVFYKKTTKPFLWWNKVVETEDIDLSKTIWYNEELDLYIEGETIYALLMEYIDKQEESYQLKLEERKKKRLKEETNNKAYRDKLLTNKKD